MRIVLLGAPGSGKGTQGELLGRKLRIPRISSGDIFRAEIAARTPLGSRAQDYVAVGSLVPDELVLKMMDNRLRQPDTKAGFILDGFPRSIPQARGLEPILGQLGARLDVVLKLDLAKKILIERLTSRRVCPSCTAVYNVITSPPRAPGVCDRCGSRLVQREDDDIDTVRRRLNVDELATGPVVDYYDSRGILAIVNGEGTVREVEARIEKALEQRRSGN